MSLTDSRVRTLRPSTFAELLVADGGGLYIRIRRGRNGITRTWQ
jgi:hypothetical protein